MGRTMKDSGIEWIGEIPEDWDKDKVVRIFSTIGSGTTPKSNDENYFDGKNNWIQSGDINGGILKECKTKISDEAVSKFSALKLYVSPFLIMAMYGASVGNLSISKIDGYVNQACCVLKSESSNMKYLFYSLYAARDELILHAMGSGQPNISQNTIKQLWLPFPPKKEQEIIVNLLDSKCNHINAILNKTRTSIEEYKKLKQSIITQAVTKGIRPNRKMKDSGIEWIGEIPEEWDIRRAKYYVNISHGSDPKTKGDIPVYGSGTESFKSCSEYKEGPCVLVGRKGATLHIPHYIDHRYWNVDTAFDVHEKENFCLKFYYYLACCFDYKYYISQTTLPGMTQTDYENMILPIPTNKGEQEEISDYLDEKTSVLEKMIERKEQLLTELENYKKSLIFEYVTGKKEVSVA